MIRPHEIAAMLGVLCLSHGALGEEPSFSLGGEVRVRPEYRDNADFNSQRDDRTSFVGQRVRLGYSGVPVEGTRGRLELQHTMLWGTEFLTASRSDIPGADIHQAYISLENISQTPLTMTIGRQELSYGEERLVGAFDWSNFGRSFDALRLRWGEKLYSLDAFGAQIVERSAKVVGNPPVVSPTGNFGSNTFFSGIYGSARALTDQVYEAYILYLRDGVRKPGEGGTGTPRSLDIATAGVRATGEISSLDLAGELAYQFGYNYADTHQAVAGVARAGYTFGQFAAAPRLMLEYIYATGDKEYGDGKSGEFINLFPTNHARYGAMDYFGWHNISAGHLGISGAPVPGFRVYADYFYFTLPQGQGSWKDAAGNEVIPIASTGGIFAGHEADLRLAYLYRLLGVEAGYSIFFPGSYVKDFQGRADPSQWAYLQTRLRF